MPDKSATFTNTVGPTVTWSAVSTADTEIAYALNGGKSSRGAVQFDGTFGGATVVLQGSVDGTTYVTLRDTAGNAISDTSADVFFFETAVNYIKPLVTGGTGDSLNIRVALRD
jgi:hypothetical protein